MKNIKLIFYVLYGLMVLGTLYIAFDLEGLFSRYGRLTFIDFLQGWIIATIVFMIAVVVVEQWQAANFRSQIKKLEKEKEQLKSKLYDLEAEFKENETKINQFQSSLKPSQKEMPAASRAGAPSPDAQNKITPRQNAPKDEGALQKEEDSKEKKDKQNPEKRF